MARNKRSKQQAKSDDQEITDQDIVTNDMYNKLSEEGKNIVLLICTRISSILKNQEKLEAKVQELESKNKAMEERCSTLEDRIDDQEQYTMRENIIISGPGVPEEIDTENTSNMTVQLLKSKCNIDIKEEDISTSHRLGVKKPNVKRSIIVRLTRRDLKKEIKSSCILSRPNIFVNEQLTEKRRNIFNRLRIIRQHHYEYVKVLRVNDGIIKARKTDVGKMYFIKNEDNLKEFIQDIGLNYNTCMNLQPIRRNF